MKTRLFTALSVVVSLLMAATVAQAQDGGFLDGDLGGVEVWSFPDANAPAGTLAAHVRLTSAEGTKLVTFENVAIQGKVHQVWDDVLMGPTAKGAPAETALYNTEWVPYDTHLAVSEDMVGGQAGGGYNGITEENDGSTTDALSLPPATAAGAISGVGGLAMGLPTDAFFLDTDFQSNSVEWAYIVTPAAGYQDGDVTLTVGVLGEGIVNSGEDGGAFFNGIAISMVPEPASGLMALVSVMGLAMLRRRKRQ